MKLRFLLAVPALLLVLFPSMFASAEELEFRRVDSPFGISFEMPTIYGPSPRTLDSGWDMREGVHPFGDYVVAGEFGLLRDFVSDGSLNSTDTLMILAPASDNVSDVDQKYLAELPRMVGQGYINSLRHKKARNKEAQVLKPAEVTVDGVTFLERSLWAHWTEGRSRQRVAVYVAIHVQEDPRLIMVLIGEEDRVGSRRDDVTSLVRLELADARERIRAIFPRVVRSIMPTPVEAAEAPRS